MSWVQPHEGQHISCSLHLQRSDNRLCTPGFNNIFCCLKLTAFNSLHLFWWEMLMLCESVAETNSAQKFYPITGKKCAVVNNTEVKHQVTLPDIYNQRQLPQRCPAPSMVFRAASVCGAVSQFFVGCSSLHVFSCCGRWCAEAENKLIPNNKKSLRMYTLFLFLG